MKLTESHHGERSGDEPAYVFRRTANGGPTMMTTRLPDQDIADLRAIDSLMTTIAVVGAGFSGTLLTLHLLRRCPPPTQLVLIERNSQFGRGLAYATGNASHILNVPAGRMSAFHDRPNDFLEWLTSQPESDIGISVGPGTFAPRQLFGAYIRALLNDEIKRSGRDRLELVKGDVIGLDQTGRPLVLTVDRNRTVQADLVVLADRQLPA